MKDPGCAVELGGGVAASQEYLFVPKLKTEFNRFLVKYHLPGGGWYSKTIIHKN